LELHGPIGQPSDLLQHRLISCTCAPEEWHLWMERNGSSPARARHWLEVDTRAAALQAAQEGLGIVIGRRPFADLALARGHLCQMFPEPVPTGMSYFIVAPHRSWSSRNVRAFCSWLAGVARDTNPFATPEANSRTTPVSEPVRI
jgi:LysR family glycine cleavage system transcriptional activator